MDFAGVFSRLELCATGQQRSGKPRNHISSMIRSRPSPRDEWTLQQRSSCRMAAMPNSTVSSHMQNSNCCVCVFRSSTLLRSLGPSRACCFCLIAEHAAGSRDSSFTWLRNIQRERQRERQRDRAGQRSASVSSLLAVHTLL